MYTFNDADASNVQKTPAGTLLTRTTTIRGGDDTLRIFRSGKDAAGLNRSDVLASAETRCQKCTRMYTFGKTTQMCRIFSKVLLALIFFDSITQMLKGNARLFEHLD